MNELDEFDFEIPIKKEIEIVTNDQLSAKIKTKNKHLYRRAFSESKLLDLFGRESFEDGASYHCISNGDIDSLSYLKCIIRKQPLDYCLFSTWCMALPDVEQLNIWVKNGDIKRLDAYVGEIFKGTYSKEYSALEKIVNLCKGRVCVARNHSKIYAGFGNKFAFAIESSANINTNPRIENTAIHIGFDIYQFYKDFFDGLISFDRSYDGWTKW